MSDGLAVDVEHSPARISGTLAVVAALIAAVASGLASTLALVFGLLGLVGLAGGVFALHSRGAVAVSTGLVFLGVLVSGVVGNSPAMLLASGVGTVLALDLGQNAVSVGRQLTDDADTRRGEFAHAAASTVVGVVAAAVGYGIYWASAGGQPVGALVLLLVAALCLVWSIKT